MEEITIRTRAQTEMMDITAKVQDLRDGRLVLKTRVGGERVVDLPAGELVPRIC